MSRPAVEPFTEKIYAALAPLAREDEALGWPLLTYLNSIGRMEQPIEDLIRDTDEGPGWSALVDVDRAPAEALGWLAQFVGVTVRAGLSESEQRELIRAVVGFNRGTLASILSAMQPHLTGNKTIIVRERDGSAYRLTIITRTDETPDSGAVLDAILSQKPAGIKLTYTVLAGQDWTELVGSHADWAAVVAAYPTWDDAVSDTP